MATSNTAILNKLKKQLPPWNVNIFAQLIVPHMLQRDDGFITRSIGLIEKARNKFFNGLSEISSLKIYPSAANFFLIKLCGDVHADELSEQLAQKNILIRNCSNLRGLDDTYVRVAVMREEENEILVGELQKAQR
jgi:threonine-phosphate decarboxylase